MQLRKKPGGATQYRKPKIVLPQESSHRQEHEQSHVVKPLQAEVPLEFESVRQFEFAYYSFQLDERKVVHQLSGLTSPRRPTSSAQPLLASFVPPPPIDLASLPRKSIAAL